MARRPTTEADLMGCGNGNYYNNWAGPYNQGYYLSLGFGQPPKDDSGYIKQLFAPPGGGPGEQPLLSGVAVFGDPKRFAAAVFTGDALEEDGYLDLAPGSTQYGPCQAPGGAIACSGYLTGTSVGAVQAAQATLAGYAGAAPGELTVPTGIGCGGWDLWRGCWIAHGDLSWSQAGIVPSVALGTGFYEIGYSVVFRRSGPPAN
jgi:hypothetical protein